MMAVQWEQAAPQQCRKPRGTRAHANHVHMACMHKGRTCRSAPARLTQIEPFLLHEPREQAMEEHRVARKTAPHHNQ